MNNSPISIAIDGPSGVGKSTQARRCASAFGFLYVDTGAIYRTVGLAAYRRGIDRKDSEAVGAMLPNISIDLRYNDAGEQRMFLDGEDVSEEIRKPEISICASDVSALPVVRDYLLQMQRSLAEKNNVIMDGRDIGTVVLPNADLKIFLTASAEERARRRFLELQKKGSTEPFEQVLKEVKERDEQDMNRPVEPLRQAEDAVLVDTTNLGFDEVVEAILAIVEEKQRG